MNEKMTMSFIDCGYGSHQQTMDELTPTPCGSEEAFIHDALSVDHMESTPLYDAIQSGDWGGVDFFLETGAFTFSPFQCHEYDMAAPEDQAETWVVCTSGQGKLLWRQLPIHAAICYGAPFDTIQKLLEAYPASLQCADNEGNLPLHLAVKFNKPNDILFLIFQAFPGALEAKNGKGNCPLDCGRHLEDEKARDRFHVFRALVTNSHSQAQREYKRNQRDLRAAILSVETAKKILQKAKSERNKARKSRLQRLVERVNPQKTMLSG